VQDASNPRVWQGVGEASYVEVKYAQQ